MKLLTCASVVPVAPIALKIRSMVSRPMVATAAISRIETIRLSRANFRAPSVLPAPIRWAITAVPAVDRPRLILKITCTAGKQNPSAASSSVPRRATQNASARSTAKMASRPIIIGPVNRRTWRLRLPWVRSRDEGGLRCVVVANSSPCFSDAVYRRAADNSFGTVVRTMLPESL